MTDDPRGHPETVGLLSRLLGLGDNGPYPEPLSKSQATTDCLSRVPKETRVESPSGWA